MIVPSVALILICFFGYTNSLFFDLFYSKETCFTDEFVNDSVVIIQFRPLASYDVNEEFKEGHYIFNIKNTENEILETLYGTKLEDKVFYIVKDTGSFNICVMGNRKSKIYANNSSIKFSLIIDTDDKIVNLPHDELPDNHHLNLLERKVHALSTKTLNIMKSQKSNMETEDEFSEFQIKNNETLFIMTMIQIAIIVLLFLYTCCSLRTSLRNSLSKS